MPQDGGGFLSNIHSGPRRDIAADILFRIPIVREVLLWLGNVSASRSVVNGVLKKGMSLMVYTGGEREQMLSQVRSRPALCACSPAHGTRLCAQVGEHTIYLRKRLGMIRMAIKHGVPLVPVYAFGETDLYATSRFAMGLRMWLVRNLRIALPLFWGRFPFPLWRAGSRITFAIGKPVAPPARNPSSPYTFEKNDPAVVKLHEEFMAAMTKTFNEFKAQAGYPNAQLVIV